MSGEGLGYAVGAGILLAAGGTMAAAFITGGLAAAALYTGYHVANGTGRLVLSGLDKRRQNMLDQISKEIAAFEFHASLSEDNILSEMDNLYQSREKDVQELKAIFDADQDEGALERFLDRMYQQNISFVEGISKQKEELIGRYEENIKADLASLFKVIQEKQNHVETKINQMQTDAEKHQEATRNEAEKVYAIATMLLKQLQKGYTEVEDVCPAEIENIKQELEYADKQLTEGTDSQSYEHIIALCTGLPAKIMECMNACDKYRIGKYVYLDASEKILAEIQKFLETQKEVEYKQPSGDSAEDSEGICSCEISRFMKGKYEEILNQIDQYYLSLREKANFNEVELVDTFHQICNLYTTSIHEVVNGMERIRSHFMREDMAVEIVDDLVKQGYSLQKQHSDMEEGTVSIDFVNYETGNTVTVLLSENDYVNYTGQIELVNNIKISHVSEQPLTDETEEERLIVRERVMGSINSSQHLEREYGVQRCNIVCQTDSYMKNPS